jgi:hypothetical protein
MNPIERRNTANPVALVRVEGEGIGRRWHRVHFDGVRWPENH